MKSLASEETYTRYDELSTRSFLSSIPNFRYCLRSGCNSGQIHDSGVEGNIFRCSACDFLVCTTHDEAFHTGETCEEYDKRKSCEPKVEDDASAEMIQDTTKQCPGEGCGVRIEKNDGCDHMTCRRCSHQFCWQCLAPYRGPRGIYTVNNSMHNRSCRYFSGAPARELSPSPPPRELNRYPPPRALTLSPPLYSPLPGLVPRIYSVPDPPHDHRHILVQPPLLPTIVNDTGIVVDDDHDGRFHARGPENTYVPVQRNILSQAPPISRNGGATSAARSNISSKAMSGYSARRPMVSVPRPIVPASRPMSSSPL